jgi:anti-sigma factor RsiW
MNCHDARERLSDFLDEALSLGELGEVRSHLEGCPECTRELERLRATLSILSRVDRPRAPVGFVDRVMEAARPVPWYRRLGRWLFVPLGTKLPAEAAAMAMIAVLGVFLLQRTPEMKEATRPEFQAPASRIEAPARVETPAAKNNLALPSQAQAPAASMADKLEAGKLAEQAPKGREAENTVRDARRRDLGQPPISSSPSGREEPRQEFKQELNKEADDERSQKAGAPRILASPPPPAAAPGAMAPTAPPAETRAKSRDSGEGQSGATIQLPPAPMSPALGAKRQSALSGVIGRLNVKDRPSAEKGLADLLSRVGGSEAGRRQELGATVVDVLVPEGRYADFVRGLATLGAWVPEGPTASLPTDPQQLRFSIRIAE